MVCEKDRISVGGGVVGFSSDGTDANPREHKRRPCLPSSMKNHMVDMESTVMEQSSSVWGNGRFRFIVPGEAHTKSKCITQNEKMRTNMREKEYKLRTMLYYDDE